MRPPNLLFIFTDEQRETLQTWMNEVYDTFKGHVLSSRKDRLKKELDAHIAARAENV